jgi:hypothetical protein
MAFMKLARDLLNAAILAALYGNTFAADGIVTLGAGADYTTGKYGGTQKTEILYLPFTAKYETGPWAFKAVVPYISITGPSNVVGSDSVMLSDGSANQRTDAGLGDIVASVFYNLVSTRNSPFGLDIGGKVKLGTADRSAGLGTGEDDFSLQADIFKPMGAVTAFGSLGYRWYGDPPGTHLQNVFYGALGASYRMSSQTSVGLAYDFRPRITPSGGQRSEATAFLSQRFSPNWKLQFYALAGFSRASPDFGAGANVSYNF